VIGDFNIDILTNTSQSMTLQNIMNENGLKNFLSFEITIIYNTQNHIWTNALTQQYHFGSMKAHWTNYKPIYLAFKLPNYVAKFNLLHNKQPPSKHFK
jgi:hypothetical protein